MITNTEGFVVYASGKRDHKHHREVCYIKNDYLNRQNKRYTRQQSTIKKKFIFYLEEAKLKHDQQKVYEGCLK